MSVSCIAVSQRAQYLPSISFLKQVDNIMDNIMDNDHGNVLNTEIVH